MIKEEIANETKYIAAANPANEYWRQKDFNEDFDEDMDEGKIPITAV